ncbi:MAG: ATP-binding protein, partial [Bradymonadaceae bacterium]
ELSQICKDGSSVTVEGRWTLVRDDDGKPHRILSINTDVTEKKKLLAQYLRAQRMEGIGTLAGGIAHDLNNVLAPIMLSLGLLRMQAGDAKTREILSDVEAAAQRGADMVRQILSYARGAERTNKAVDVEHSILEIEKVIRDTFPKNITFIKEIRADRRHVAGDPTQIHQVLLNLCVNSRDAMPRGGSLRVTVANLDLEADHAATLGAPSPGRYVRISVADSGIGMSAHIKRQLFDPFFTTKEVGRGTGLGLPTVESIMRSHGGFLNVESEPGVGTTFKVYFSAYEGEEVEVEIVETRENLRGAGELVLVIDDEASIRSIMARTLEGFGYRVITAIHGADAVAIVARRGEEVNVVLTDMTMPIMDGPTTIRALKRMQPDLRIIAISGLSAGGGQSMAIETGADYFLAKPFTSQSVLEVLYRALHS